jgi:lipopolysaccharide transport system ATP-binding protein
MLMAPFSRKAAPRDDSWFWALHDVSFDVNPGDVLGIVGSNGAGKSTLLKILARVAEPTAGRIEMAGRLGCLLEVGTGFHRELTGRENVFLNGAILGMSKRETQAKFDAIVDFSGIEQFIDTPVKHYSSGMYLRLGFAVAAHIDPEILIIDEVLAVGDAAFQAKCIGKVSELVGEGRTVLIVSHQLPVVQKLCNRAILIRNGQVAADGSPQGVISEYLRAFETSANGDLGARSDRKGRGQARISRISVIGTGGPALTSGTPAKIEIEAGGKARNCAFTIYDSLGDAVVSFDTANPSRNDDIQEREANSFRCEMASLFLRPGRYRINAALTALDGSLEDHIEGACTFEVLPGLIDGREAISERGYGRVEFPHRWTVS